MPDPRPVALTPLDALPSLVEQRLFPCIRAWTAALGLAVVSGASSVAATPDRAQAEMCDRWAAVAAVEHGVPERLLLAITRVETGRAGGATAPEVRPWPWAVNAGGDGHWLPSKQAAAAFVRAQLRQGQTQVDVGCFQLNIHWHGRAFASVEEMIDPSRNARYAARFLARLHGEFGTWSGAAAAFHSRTPQHGRAYLARLDGALQTLGGGAAGESLARTAQVSIDGGIPTTDAGRVPGQAAPLIAGAAVGGSLPHVPSGDLGADAPPGGVALGGLVWVAPTAHRRER